MSTLYSDGQHTNMLLGEPEIGSSFGSHRYLILDHGKGFILEHGLQETLSQAFQAISNVLNPSDLEYVFISMPLFHLEIALNRWIYASEAKALCAESWVSYLRDVRMTESIKARLVTVPDQGTQISFGNTKLDLIPAHFLFNSCAFCLYDPIAKILFSGELASSLTCEQLVLDSFEEMRPLIEPIHTRYATSQAVIKKWVQNVRELDIHIVAPRRGCILKGERQIEQLWDWLEATPCGLDLS